LLAKAMCEAVQKSFIEWEPSPRTFQLLLYHLRWLTGHPNPEGVFSSFLLILLDHLGLAPVLHRCARCNREFGPRSISFMQPDEGGLVCAACADGFERSIRVSAKAREALRDALGRKRGRKNAISTSKDISREQIAALRAFFEHHLHRRLTSLAIRDALTIRRTASPRCAT
ncbi:MAG TPA: DNA repair protein RecO, partial [Proteobacteria bacterium]|nr:DNA repair protein RecO [Pseudomonadota bacterium]